MLMCQLDLDLDLDLPPLTAGGATCYTTTVGTADGTPGGCFFSPQRPLVATRPPVLAVRATIQDTFEQEHY